MTINIERFKFLSGREKKIQQATNKLNLLVCKSILYNLSVTLDLRKPDKFKIE